MSLIFKMQSSLDIAFLWGNKHILISWLLSPAALILESKKVKCLTVSTVSPSICHGVMGPDTMILFFKYWVLTKLFHFAQEASQFLFAFCHNGGVICISEVINISPSNLDSSMCFMQLAFCMMYSAYKLNKQSDNIPSWCTPFLIWNQSVVPCPVLTFAFWPGYRFLRRQVRCSGIPISFRIFHSLLWSTQRLWHSQ